MAFMLRDADIKKLLGTVILDGTEKNIRPNSYIIRVGGEGEFINTGKSFSIKNCSGIKIPAGHSVGIISYEKLDFTQETVDKIFPGCALHAFISPTTDLSREGVIAPSTQVDAGFKGVLNWTIANTSSQERCYVFEENLFRLTIFKLEPGEVPQNLYAGDYQFQEGYVRSQRKGAPVGMRPSDWVGPYLQDGPEELLKSLMESGYPWQVIGTELKSIDDQFGRVAKEYKDVKGSLEEVRKDLVSVKDSIGLTVKKVIEDQMQGLETVWVSKLFSFFLVITGVFMTVLSSEKATNIIKEYSFIIGSVILMAGVVALVWFSRRKK